MCSASATWTSPDCRWLGFLQCCLYGLLHARSTRVVQRMLRHLDRGHGQTDCMNHLAAPVLVLPVLHPQLASARGDGCTWCCLACVLNAVAACGCTGSWMGPGQCCHALMPWCVCQASTGEWAAIVHINSQSSCMPAASGITAVPLDCHALHHSPAAVTFADSWPKLGIGTA